MAPPPTCSVRGHSAGYDAEALSRLLVANGVIEDDQNEPNDRQDDATVQLHDRWPPGYYLNPPRLLVTPHNDDWFTVDITHDGAEIVLWVDPFFNEDDGRELVLRVELRSEAGDVLAARTARRRTSMRTSTT